MFARAWRPTGLWLIPLEVTYSVTDPPLKGIRRILPPLRIGSVSLDLGFFVLFILVMIARQLVASA
jgi:YggT family protein